MFPSLEKMAEVIGAAPAHAAAAINPDPLVHKPNNLAIMKWYQKQIEWAEEQISGLENLYNIKATCRKGCHACCRQLIWTTRAEIDILRTYIQALDREQIVAIASRAARNTEVLEQEFGTTSMARMTFNSKETRQRYYNLNLMCPFLDDAGLCAVYPVRPSNCWAYRSYGDPAECQDNPAPQRAIHYKDLEYKVVVDNLYKIKKPQAEVTLLPAAIVEALRDLV